MSNFKKLPFVLLIHFFCYSPSLVQAMVDKSWTWPRRNDSRRIQLEKYPVDKYLKDYSPQLTNLVISKVPPVQGIGVEENNKPF